MRKTTRKVAFLPTLGFLEFDFNIFYCNTSCLVYLPTQHRRKPIQGTDRSFHSETGVYGWISRAPGSRMGGPGTRTGAGTGSGGGFGGHSGGGFGGGGGHAAGARGGGHGG